MQINPFITTGYISGEYFCDREKETEHLISLIKNGNNVTLVSQRRIGKTGLIQHVFEKLKTDTELTTIYVDIFSTRSIEDFIKQISEAILKKFPDKTTIGKTFWEFIKRLRPLITYDNITGDPQIQINYQTENEKTHTLQNIFELLEKQKNRVIIAIDEFQQITEYPEKNLEANLRSQIQFLKKTSFIFCGSKRKILFDMFSNAKRPFYMSTQFMLLDKIDRAKYADFIENMFKKYDITIEKEATELILNLSKVYTFYTQKLCNRIFSYKPDIVCNKNVLSSFSEILEENRLSYLQLRELLTKAQWNYLIAVAKEDNLSKITGQNFLMKNKIGTASNSKRLMEALTEKDLISELPALNETNYTINDVFLFHWLRETY
ncbi:MAG: ATP-binding protein [Paludibacter sp.]|nr:ATP-binding protein [Paludibacter sp.]